LNCASRSSVLSPAFIAASCAAVASSWRT
jgi:hypothetical protein